MKLAESKNLLRSESNAIGMLVADHRQVDVLFKQFEASTSKLKRVEIVTAICRALVIHADLEEQIFGSSSQVRGNYPSLECHRLLLFKRKESNRLCPLFPRTTLESRRAKRGATCPWQLPTGMVAVRRDQITTSYNCTRANSRAARPLLRAITSSKLQGLGPHGRIKCYLRKSIIESNY